MRRSSTTRSPRPPRGCPATSPTPVAENTFQYNESFCLNESCHNMTRDELTESTSDMAFNPHVQQHGDIDCGECHKAHSSP